MPQLRSFLPVLALGFFASGCGDEHDAPPADDNVPVEAVTFTISPTIWVGGEIITVTGKDFTSDSTLTFAGSFNSQYVVMTYKNIAGFGDQAQFRFEGDGLPPGVGHFSGQFTVTDFNTTALGAQPAEIDVAPSIFVTHSGPVSGCAAQRISGTLPSTDLELDLSIAGLGHPTLSITYVSWNGTFRKEDRTGAKASLTFTSGDPFADDRVSSNRGESVVVVATDATGATLTRTIPYSVYRQYDVRYDGTAQVVELFTPQAVTGCLPGGETGESYTYSESVPEVRSRAYSFSYDFDVPVEQLNRAFGFDVASTVSSASSVGGISHSVFPHWYGAFYRQTSKLSRPAFVSAVNVCGENQIVGQVYVSDWTFTPGFNQTQSACPGLPVPLMSDDGALLSAE